MLLANLHFTMAILHLSQLQHSIQKCSLIADLLAIPSVILPTTHRSLVYLEDIFILIKYVRPLLTVNDDSAHIKCKVNQSTKVLCE